MKYDEDKPAEAIEWRTYDERTERLVQLRSDSENWTLAAGEQETAYADASALHPSQAEWEQARMIAEQRWQLRKARCERDRKPSPRPLSRVTRPTAPVWDSDCRRRTDFRHPNAEDTMPRSPRVRTAPGRDGEVYWYRVELERQRRAWMTRRGFAYEPRFGIFLEDLDRARPRRLDAARMRAPVLAAVRSAEHAASEPPRAGHDW